jgi:hypothetical protein
MLVATIVLPALSGLARAQNTDDDGCTNATLKGDYAFAVNAWIGQPPTPLFVVGIARFDGRGGFTQVDYIGDSLRTRGQTDFSTGETTTYRVNSDCTGSGEIHFNVPGVPAGTSHGVTKIVFVISHGGRSVHQVVSESTPPGGTQPVPIQARADFWAVGSAEDN